MLRKKYEFDKRNSDKTGHCSKIDLKITRKKLFQLRQLDDFKKFGIKEFECNDYDNKYLRVP